MTFKLGETEVTIGRWRPGANLGRFYRVLRGLDHWGVGVGRVIVVARRLRKTEFDLPSSMVGPGKTVEAVPKRIK